MTAARRASHAYIGIGEVDELLFSWGRVIAWAKTHASKWEAGFALSIQRDRKRPNWRPSHKQLAVMHQLKARADRDAPAIWDEDDLPGGSLIED